MEIFQQRLETLFEAALEIENSRERAEFLARECANDPTLRSRVGKLLTAYAQSGEFFEGCRPALRPNQLEATTGEFMSPDEEEGKLIGHYKLLQKIGEGGWGMVYMAEQQKPVTRRVALKIIKQGMDTKSVIARFEAERQALAMMDHPNIAHVLDAGATETGRPYFVMELVHGIRITEYCDKRQLDTRQRLDLFVQVCFAIQHAHQKGIIHRDIKPSNVLVTLHDSVAVPKVIDFGISKAIEQKLTDKTLFTFYGHFVGTPAYMSPEQADISGLDIDTRSDIYSLGVLLYELLTSKTPFEQNELLSSGLDEMRRTLREREPYRPSLKLGTLQTAELTITAQRRHIEPPRLQSILKGDLDWIVMKALEKDRKRRYQTANGMAADIQRYLDNEPVTARPPSRWYRFQKLVRRNRGVFAAAGAVALALMIGLGTATWLVFKERAMEEHEAELRRQAETREKITQAALLISQGKFAEADALKAKIKFLQPTLEGASVLRSLGEWHAINNRWQLAANRYLEVVQVDQLDDSVLVAKDFLAAGACLAAADDTNRFETFRQTLAHCYTNENNTSLAVPLLEAGLFLPTEHRSPDLLSPLIAAVTPSISESIGNSQTVYNDEFLKKLKLQDVGTAQLCSMRVDGGDITIVSGGSDIWLTNDAFAYAYGQIAGDFDFRMEAVSVSPMLDKFTRVGLMARESPDRTNSRHVMVAFNAENSFQVVMRSAEGASAESVPQNPLPAAYGSSSWLRLQRVGAIFHAYTSSNGVDWVQLYQTTGGDKPFSDPIYFGIAASSHKADGLATNIVRDFGPTLVVSPHTALTWALWEYRRANYNSAVGWCHRLLNYPESSIVDTTEAQAILALCYQRLNQAGEANKQLASSQEALLKHASEGLGPGNQEDGFWFDWILAQELVNEAKETTFQN